MLRRTLLPLAGAVALAGCGAGSSGSHAAGDCTTVWTSTLGGVAQRVYGQAAGGRNMAAAVTRLSRSVRLAAAAAAGSPSAVRAAVAPLTQRQIVALHVYDRRGALLYAYGRGVNALGPRGGTLAGDAGTFTVSVLSDDAYVGLTSRITGSAVAVTAGGRRLASSRTVRVALPGRAYAFSAGAFPTGTLHISLLIPRPPATACGAGTEQTVAFALGHAARNIYAQELGSGYIAFALRAYRASPALRAAVAAGDRAGALRAVNAVYDRHIHVVRVQVRDPQGRLLADSGVRWALAPVHGSLPGGGTVSFSEQDDLGFGTLVHRFTGAQVVLRSGGTQVPGSTLAPSSVALPTHGSVLYDGREYRVASFLARGFPSRTVRVTVLVPAS
jgi:hypothetical protein